MLRQEKPQCPPKMAHGEYQVFQTGRRGDLGGDKMQHLKYFHNYLFSCICEEKKN